MNEPTCPVCRESFPEDDFCPRHGEALILPLEENTEQAEDEIVSNKCEVETGTEPDSVDEAHTEASADKLSKFMSKLGLRHVHRDKDTDNDADASPHEGMGSVLPCSLVDEQWTVSGPVATGQGVDCWTLERTASGVTERGVYHRFRTGALTKPQTYKRLAALSSSLLPDVIANGTVDMGGARTDFELVASKDEGTRLDSWFGESDPSEARAQHLLGPLARLLTELHDLGLHPIVLEASQLSIRDDGQLALVTASAIADAQPLDEGVVHYRPEFMRSALLSRSAAAPEVVQQAVTSGNMGVFSVGQLLAQAIWGQHITHAELQSGAVPFNTLRDARLANILKGCLWPKSKGRWSHLELAEAIHCPLEKLPRLNAWESLTPGASSTAFGFAGEAFWRLEDLLQQAIQPQHWDEAVSRMREILQWAEDTVWVGQTRLMAEQLELGKSADYALISLCSLVCPESPPTWRDHDFSNAFAKKSLGSLAQKALRGSEAAATTIMELFKSDLRGAFVSKKERSNQTTDQELITP